MRLVYGGALGAVARFLGIGAPSTATVPVDFDDALLQQVLDVRTMVPGLGSEDGWFGAIQDHIHSSTGILRNQLDIYARIESPTGGLDFSGAPRNSVDVWVMRCSLLAAVVGGNAITNIISGIQIPAIANSPFPTADHQHLVSRALSFSGVPLIASGFGPGITGHLIDTNIRPIRVPHTATLAMLSQSTVAATTITARSIWFMWAGPRGARPPLVA